MKLTFARSFSECNIFISIEKFVNCAYQHAHKNQNIFVIVVVDFFEKYLSVNIYRIKIKGIGRGQLF